MTHIGYWAVFHTVYMQSAELYSCPVQAAGHNALLIHLLISALYILFACLLGFSHLLSFFFTYFSSLIYVLPYVFL